MKRALTVALMVVLLSSPPGAQTQILDYDSYVSAAKRAATIFAQLRLSEHRAWTVEVALRECGYPVPEELALSKDQLGKLIIDTATTSEELDLTMHVLLALEGWIAGYKAGIATALGDFTPDACRTALKDAKDILALR
jgi:hypothetical protein